MFQTFLLIQGWQFQSFACQNKLLYCEHFWSNYLPFLQENMKNDTCAWQQNLGSHDVFRLLLTTVRRMPSRHLCFDAQSIPYSDNKGKVFDGAGHDRIHGYQIYIVKLMLNSGTSWKWVVSLTRRPPYSQRKSLRYPLKRRLVYGTQGRYGRFGQDKHFFPRARNQTMDRQACSIVTIPTAIAIISVEKVETGTTCITRDV